MACAGRTYDGPVDRCGITDMGQAAITRAHHVRLPAAAFAAPHGHKTCFFTTADLRFPPKWSTNPNMDLVDLVFSGQHRCLTGAVGFPRWPFPFGAREGPFARSVRSSHPR